MTWGFVAAAVITTAGSVYESSQQNKIANRGLSLAENTQGKQDYYNQQLMQLMASPGDFLNNPLFKSTLDVGLSGVNRTMAAEGYLGSSNQATALEQYGQSFASSQLFQQEELLGGLSGAQQNPASGLNVASGATSQAAGGLNSLAGLLAFYGSSGMGGGGSGFTPNNAGAGGSTSGWFSNSDMNNLSGWPNG